jgi:cytochrome oxidase Cu insertion factor (SCO1/SenC/PrrC family)
MNEETEKTQADQSSTVRSAVVAKAFHRRGPWLVALLAVWVVVILGIGTFAIVRFHHQQQQIALSDIRPSGIPASVSTNVADLMGLSPVPHRPAPSFVLTDQRGRIFSLSSFRGKTVVLEFMDPHCTDICPIVSDEFVDAYHDLGHEASHVVFLAVNVNQFHRGVADMMAYSREHNLLTIPSWHFFTGPVARLRSVWSSYNVEVDAPNPNADIIHTSIVYFIDPHGIERYVASPMDDHTATGAAYLPAGQLSSWGRGIALVASHLAS